MPVGLFGKYPAKRDFVSLGLPRQILDPFETWLQSAVAASRNQLGRDWQDLYLVAPLWRFWIGPEVFGLGCAGVTMPSVDGIGRFFPLTLIAHGPPKEFCRPPTLSPEDAWYRSVEERLLTALSDEEAGDPARFTEALERPAPPPIDDDGGTEFLRGRLWRGEEAETPAFLEGLRDADHIAAASARSLWWTKGGAAFEPAVYGCAGLPDPYFYVRMIGGP